ncbi:MAG: hypothetical protein ACOY3Y_11555 [Acidobacteriota bacterium]
MPRVRPGVACASLALASGLLVPTVAGAWERPQALLTLLPKLMANPTEKHDGKENRVDYILKLGVMKVPSQPGVPLDPSDPNTFSEQNVSVALLDTFPHALRAEQLGEEDVLLVRALNPRSGHLTWEMRDVGVKGPDPEAQAGPVAFFGQDNQAVYRDYLERIVAALEAAAKETER